MASASTTGPLTITRPDTTDNVKTFETGTGATGYNRANLDNINAAFNASTGHDHDGTDSKKVIATDLDPTGLTVSQYLRVNSGGTALETALIPAAAIANRTRHIYLPASVFYPVLVSAGSPAEGILVADRYSDMTFNDNGASIKAGATFQMPADYVSGTVTVKLLWSTSATTGDIPWNVSMKSIADGEVITAGSETDTYTTFTANGVANTLQVATSGISFTPASAASYQYITVGRRGDLAADTLAAAARLIGVRIEYTADM